MTDRPKIGIGRYRIFGRIWPNIRPNIRPIIDVINGEFVPNFSVKVEKNYCLLSRDKTRSKCDCKIIIIYDDWKVKYEI